jgi:hypothetical protein
MALTVARLLEQYHFRLSVSIHASSIVYLIFVDGASSRQVYVGRTFRGLVTRFAQHRYLAWGPRHVLDARRASLYEFLHGFPEEQVVMLPILFIPHIATLHRDIVADCLERRSILLFRSHVTMGGLNSYFPSFNRSLAVPVHHLDRVFCPVQFLFSRVQQAEDGFVLPGAHACSRDYSRRLAFLLRQIWQGVTPADLDLRLRSFRLRNLVKMYSVLGLSSLPLSPSYDPASFSVLYTGLESHLLSRYRGKPPRSKDRFMVVFPLYDSQVWDMLNPQGILCSDLLDTLPPPLRDAVPLVTFKHTMPLGLQVINKRAFFSLQTLADLQHCATARCPCSFLSAFFKPDGHFGHVLTADTSFVAHFLSVLGTTPPVVAREVAHLLHLGTSYRPLHHEFLDEAYRRDLRHTWDVGLSAWLREICLDKGVPMSHARPYQELVTARFARALETIPLGTRVADPRMLVLGHPHRAALGLLHRDFLITQCDKASRNFAFMCKTRVSQLLVEDLNMQS